MRPVLLSLLGFSAGIYLLGAALPFGASRELLADEPNPMTDTDGDDLPDLLERVLGSNALSLDTDGDHSPDFVEAVTFTQPRIEDPTRPIDVSFRVLGFANPERVSGTTTSVLYVHQLFQIPSGNIEDLSGLTIFLDVNGVRMDLTELMLLSIYDLSLRFDPTRGILARLTFRIPIGPAFRTLLPVTIGAHATVAGRELRSGLFITQFGNALATLLPQGDGPGSGFAVAPLDGTEVVGNPFWSRNRLCVLELSIEGFRPGGQLCEIRNADCQPSDDDVCTTDCRNAIGGVIFLPDGLSIIRGG